MGHYRPVAHWPAALHGSDKRLRQQAVQTLGNVGPADPAVIPALASVLRDPAVGVRREGALALVKIGPPAAAAVPALREAVKDSDAKVRAYATQALEVIGDRR